MTIEPVKLTQYSHGAGCGCKIAPRDLEEILKSKLMLTTPGELLVGNSSKDDAAVYDLGNGTALISTTDFFMPIVDDAFDFGRIAAANSISDVYAMGGKPLMAIAILGWPIGKLPLELAQQMLEGGRKTCQQAGIPLAGGHSIDSPEPIFGLAVSGIVPISNLKRNDTAKECDHLFLTKPLGVGVLSTAQKRGLLKEEHLPLMVEQLTSLNSIGTELGKLKEVNAMTDVTGFGLFGHLIEMTEGSNLSAEIYYDRIPVIAGVKEYINQRIFPDATTRNWSSYGEKIKFEKGVNVMEAFTLLPDPQTNGGLLISVSGDGRSKVENLLGSNGFYIGKMLKEGEKRVWVSVSEGISA